MAKSKKEHKSKSNRKSKKEISDSESDSDHELVKSSSKGKTAAVIREELREKNHAELIEMQKELSEQLQNLQKQLKYTSEELGKKYRADIKPKKKKKSASGESNSKRGITQDVIVPEKFVKLFHLDSEKNRDKSMFEVDEDDANDVKEKKSKAKAYLDTYDESGYLSRSGVTSILYAYLRANDLMNGTHLKLDDKSEAAKKLRKIFDLDDLKKHPIKINKKGDDGENETVELKKVKDLTIKQVQTLISRVYNSDEKYQEQKDKKAKKGKSKDKKDEKDKKDKKDKKAKKEKKKAKKEESESEEEELDNKSGSESDNDSESENEVLHDLD